MSMQELKASIPDFFVQYDVGEKDKIWEQQSTQLRNFLKDRVLSPTAAPLTDDECDQVIRILDRNGKGNTKDSEAVAKAMIPQGKWRRMFIEFRENQKLGGLLLRILEASSAGERADSIDQLYALNQGQKNNLTGPSGNAVSAFLAAHNPAGQLSMISLGDRKKLIDFMGIALPFDWANASIGKRIAFSNDLLCEATESRWD
jgi:hypothetical protein